ncbi:uncharacterized protein LOC144743271 isoform X2 [Ciona intestinalis]
MVGNTTILKDPDGKQDDKKFTFDYSYWSHDGYEEQDDGYYAPVDAQYADQRKLFDDLGRGVLANAWEGFNCSLFAYGQTGSGKSYSIFGYKGNKGIVPTTCKQLFEDIAQKPSGTFLVTVSMLEIYNEKVKDLLGNKSNLKVRENAKKQEFYVEGLKVETVLDYEGIQLSIDYGNRHRTIGKTLMNDTSSRAHTIFTITLHQSGVGNEKMKKTSVINLVDLAGSERVGRNSVTGKTFDEGKNINLSLLTLGNCINSIVKNEKPAFRNSVVTKLLKNALGGNSKTIMLAALSPADCNYGDTLSTLQFADRAKNIKTKAVVNEDPNVKLIRQLREEIAQLKERLQNTPASSVSLEEYIKQIDKNEEQIKKLQDELENSNSELEAKLKEQENKIKAALEEKWTQEERRKVNFHIWNLNADKMLTGVLAHFTPTGETLIGSSDKADIQLEGIYPEHAVITNDDNEHIFISPVSEEATVRVNGIRVTRKTQLAHHDRILFGSVNLYVLEHPSDLAKLKKLEIKPPKVTFERARDEIYAHCSYKDLLEQYSIFVEGFTEDEYKKIKNHYMEKQKKEVEVLKTNHDKELKDVNAKYEKWLADAVGKLVEWNGKLVSQAEKEHAEQLEALEAEIRRLRNNTNPDLNQIAAKEEEIEALKVGKKMYEYAKQRELEEKKQWYNMKMQKLLEDFDKDIKTKDFEQECARMLGDVDQIQQNSEVMQNVKPKYASEAEKLNAENEHKYVMDTLRGLKLLLENKKLEDSNKDAMLLVEAENQCQILQQIEKERNQQKFPHFWNLNEEPDLCKVILHMVMPGESTIGSAEKAKIKMSGHGILGNHALVENDGQDVYIQPLADNIQILVNGKVVSGKQKLQDSDNIYFGPNHLYVFNKPHNGSKKTKERIITYETVWSEVTSNTSFMVNTKIINNIHGIPLDDLKIMKRDNHIKLHRLRHRLKRAQEDLNRKRQGQTLNKHEAEVTMLRINHEKELKEVQGEYDKRYADEIGKLFEKHEQELRKIKQKYKNEGEKLQAEKEHVYVMEELKKLKLLLKHKQREDTEKDAMLLAEIEKQFRVVHQIQKERNQEKVPHFWNLNVEPDLCKAIIHMVMPGQSNIGSAEIMKIRLSGHGILKTHALVENDGQDVYIQPLADNIQILVNGKVVSGKLKLQDNDRIYFGPNHLYVFNKPQDGNKKSKQPMITFEAAWTEITSNTSFMINTRIINNLHGIPSEKVENMKRVHQIELHRLRNRLKLAEKDLEIKRQPGNTLHIHVNKTSKLCLIL